MDGVGTFSKKMTYIGSLIQGDLVNNAQFETVKNNIYTRYLAYTGNRVNIYVMDQIANASRLSVPGLKLGIYVRWGFKARVPGLTLIPPAGIPIVCLRETDWNGVDPVAEAFPNYVNPLRSSSSETEAFIESKIDFGAYAYNLGGTAGTGDNSPTSYQVGDLAQNVYSFPLGNFVGGRNYCIPVVARADFMFVNFWCEPAGWVGLLPTDQVHIWAMSGSDVAGSERV